MKLNRVFGQYKIENFGKLANVKLFNDKGF